MPERFWAKVDKSTGCWLWTGAKSHGYGSFYLSTPNGWQMTPAHRVAYELLIGPLPNDRRRVFDHIVERCQDKACIKIVDDDLGLAHLELVTQRENVMRGQVGRARRENTCVHGHIFTQQNTYTTTKGSRVCLICRRASEARYRQRKREARHG